MKVINAGVGNKKIIVFCDWFAPAFKAGGPVRSAVNFVENLKNFLEIYVFTGDRDLGDNQSLAEIVPNRWLQQDGYKIYYATPEMRKSGFIKAQVNAIMPEYIYLNSMFSFHFTITPLLLKRMRSIQAGLVLAPRGMLRHSALAHKPLKKKVFLQLLKLSGIEREVVFHATDDTEVIDINNIFPKRKNVVQINNLPGFQKDFTPPVSKEENHLKLIFVGRIHPIKNLDFLLQCLKAVSAEIQLTIVAANDDEQYWAKCKKMIEDLPANISVTLFENMEHRQLAKTLEEQHVFILPTRGENFGHAIFEALTAGRPVIISDQTPWRGLYSLSVGYDLPLNNADLFIDAINKFAQMGSETFTNWCVNAWQFANRQTQRDVIINQYRELFSFK
jgi:glycosyltransferase involved in cell wall biosynthesis